MARPMLLARAGGIAKEGSTSSDEGVDTVEEAKKSALYTADMQERMGTSLSYRHEEGLNYNRIIPDLIVGSCLQTAADVDHLADHESVSTIFCLQEDSDMAYFNLDLDPILQRCQERGDIKHVRFPIRDFDLYDLRRKLPKAVTKLLKEHDSSKGGTIYIHCTAGMGRAPATALAVMNWIRGMQLDEAYSLLTGLRRCSPKIEAIRGATSDLLLGTEPIEATIAVYRSGTASKIQVAGLDVGWQKFLDMHYDHVHHRFELQRALYPGVYQYKLIVDGEWTYSIDHPTMQDGNNINNTLEVIAPETDPERAEKSARYMTPGATLTKDDEAELLAMLCPWKGGL